MTELTIDNIPYSKDEDLTEIINAIAKTKNLDNPATTSLRALSKNQDITTTKPPKIIVKFSNEHEKEQFKRRGPSDLTLDSIEYKKFPDTAQGNQIIYINENLPIHTRNLFYHTRKFKREHDFKFAWTKNGTILLRKDEDSTVFHIESLADLKAVHHFYA